MHRRVRTPQRMRSAAEAARLFRHPGRLLASGFLTRILRYGIVGVSISLAYSFAVVLAVGLLPGHGAVLASVVAFFAMLPFAYLAHRNVTFFDAAPDPCQPVRFAVTAGSTFFAAVGGMYLATAILGQSYFVGIALNCAMIPAINFIVFLFWVFRVGIVPERKAD